MKKRIVRLMSLILCLLLPFCLYSCGFDVDDESEEIPSAETMISGVTAIKLGDGEETYEEVLSMVDTMASRIIDKLYNEYGATSLVANFRDSVQDTHKNAMWQDGWLFAGEEDYGTMLGGSSLWSDEKLDKADYKLVLKYNIFQILLNKPIADISVTNLTTSSTYFQMKQAGDFGDENFTRLAKEVSHTGLFYYEADAISEYILNYMIGSTALGFDSRKFLDANGNGTFDYNENVCSVLGVTSPEYRLSRIASYAMDKERSKASSKSLVWSSIVFGDTLNDVSLPDAIIANETAYPISYLRVNNIANTYTLNGTTYYSGFKNYVNTVYYIVYTSVGNVFNMDHLPNASFEEIETEKVSIRLEDEGENNDELMNAKADTYLGAIIKAKQNLSLTSIWLYIELDESVNEEVEFSIDATYNRCVDTTNHIHSETCEFEKITSNLGSMKVKPGKVDSESECLYADLTMTEEVVQHLKESGFNTDGIVITEFAKNGISSFDLNQYVERTDENGEIVRNLVAVESGSLTSCDFELENEINDYVEIKFNITSEHDSPIKFKFAFLW